MAELGHFGDSHQMSAFGKQTFWTDVCYRPKQSFLEFAESTRGVRLSRTAAIARSHRPTGLWQIPLSTKSGHLSRLCTKV